MLPLRYPARWYSAGILLLLAVLGAALLPQFWPWNLGGIGGGIFNDKWAHLLTFAVLALWFAGQYARQSYWRIALGLLCFGVLIEICQSMLTYRTAEVADFVADVIGIVLGLVIAMLGVGGWSARVENWFVNKHG